MHIKKKFAANIFPTESDIRYNVGRAYIFREIVFKLSTEDGNTVSVNFIKCVRRVYDTVNSVAAYIEFSYLNGNLSHHITQFAFFVFRARIASI